MSGVDNFPSNTLPLWIMESGASDSFYVDHTMEVIAEVSDGWAELALSNKDKLVLERAINPSVPLCET